MTTTNVVAPAFPAPPKWREETNPDHTLFYVSAHDGPRVYVVAGPYGSHAEAEGAVFTVRMAAEERSRRAVWMGWGTSSSNERIETPLGRLGGVCPCCGDRIEPTEAFPEPPYGHTPMRIHYEHEECGATWTDDWCAAVTDTCPGCGAADIEPVEWTTLLTTGD